MPKVAAHFVGGSFAFQILSQGAVTLSRPCPSQSTQRLGKDN